ncbi:3-dehydroquinate dehydratase [Sulfurimonas sp.]|uniref:3-dehydroquinate dehydratase n=1 Tax=Sulfurimonas sp. TaxID=2022749 RepID=UPI002628B876|nr:3-dehydroquinate dehydratase [Sulfurimonas sp.]
MKIIIRGLIALILTLVFQTQLSAEYLYKDEIIHKPKLTQEVNLIGTDLYKKTGIALKLIFLKELPKNMTMYQYEKQLLSSFKEPTVLLTFSEMNSIVDIETNDKALYKYFDKKQILSPVSSYAQGLMMAAFYAKNWDEFKSMLTDVGGSILPLLGGKAHKNNMTNKYAAALFNGYLDLAQQIAHAKDVKLGNGYDADTNQETLFYVKLFFYGFVLYAIIMYIRRQIYKRRHKDEHFRKW